MEARDEGHCGLPHEELIPLAEKLLEVPTDAIESAIQEELREGAIIADQVQDADCVFLAHTSPPRIILDTIMQERIIPHGDGLAASREHHANHVRPVLPCAW
ncbi:hypothetical protein A4U49_06310 [Acidithiobacillus ferrivorans]|uniref:hypothetical protein n=1 Tax=Acidithiobacillus ferrivorans TaxID=160808 RepID=UPI000893AFB1|nr:hypothetical protein [Acidithiobacillus ferrivorans]OFA16658.1 hypothetical protein A4U49_06310 [Acidithiobacillus ferrivorans]